jgi:hypothetical protein
MKGVSLVRKEPEMPKTGHVINKPGNGQKAPEINSPPKPAVHTKKPKNVKVEKKGYR